MRSSSLVQPRSLSNNLRFTSLKAPSNEASHQLQEQLPGESIFVCATQFIKASSFKPQLSSYQTAPHSASNYVCVITCFYALLVVVVVVVSVCIGAFTASLVSSVHNTGPTAHSI